jgi:hypothetical protein
MTPPMTLRFRRLTLIGAVVVAGCGGPLFFVEVEQPSVCLNLTESEFIAAPPGFNQMRTESFQLDFPIGALTEHRAWTSMPSSSVWR